MKWFRPLDILIWSVALLAFVGVGFVLSDSPGFPSPLQPFIVLTGFTAIGWYVLRRNRSHRPLAYALLAAPLFAVVVLTLVAALL